MTKEEKQQIYKQLSAPFSDEAIERTDGKLTGKGYSTTGIKYQYIVNRLNEVLGIGCWRTEQTITVREGTTAKGRTVFDAGCDLTLQFGEWSDGMFTAWAEAFSNGGHQSMSEADARKGAFTNGLKKAAAMLGCGKQAYEGTIDDDNVPGVGLGEDAAFPPPAPQEPPNQPAQKRQPEPPPAETRQPPQGQPPKVGSGPAPASTRLRLSSKQLGAIWAMARKLGHEQSAFRKMIRDRYGVQPEFLDKHTASTIIDQMSARLSNGASHPAGNHAEANGADAAA